MHIVAAAFLDTDSAARAAHMLARRFDVGRGPALAPLAHANLPDGSWTIVAGRCPGDRLPELRALFTGFGGALVEQLDERRTEPCGGWRRNRRGREDARL
jgi:hypothetical protein